MMGQNDSYRDAIRNLSRHQLENYQRKLHRLPADAYADDGAVYFFTICARHQGEPFRSEQLAKAVVEALLWRRTHHNWHLYCYCLMPDHLHFIAGLPEIEKTMFNAGARGNVPLGILDHVARFKRYTTSQIWWKSGGEGPLWQKSSYDTVIRFGRSILPAIEYVIHNPVKAGLVAQWQDYPYVGLIDEI